MASDVADLRALLLGLDLPLRFDAPDTVVGAGGETGALGFFVSTHAPGFVAVVNALPGLLDRTERMEAELCDLGQRAEAAQCALVDEQIAASEARRLALANDRLRQVAEGERDLLRVQVANATARAEIAAQLATATASVQQLRVDVELATAQRDAETCRADNAEAQLAAVTGERGAEAAESDAMHDLIVKQAGILTAVADALKGTPPALMMRSHHDLGAVAVATVAQQEPLVTCVDALRAAATAAGWRDAAVAQARRWKALAMRAKGR